MCVCVIVLTYVNICIVHFSTLSTKEDLRKFFLAIASGVVFFVCLFDDVLGFGFGCCSVVGT